MTSLPGSPESNPASPAAPEPDSSRDDYLASVADKNRAQAAGIRTRNLVIAILGAALVILAGGFLWLGLHFEHSGSESAKSAQHASISADRTLVLAQHATDPKAQAAQVAVFYAAEATIFRKDCDAKAHQITTSNNDLGGHVQLSTLQAFCAEIVAP